MFNKIKTVFSIIGAVLSIVLFTVLLFVLRRGKIDGRKSGADSDRYRRIEEGIGKCEERADSVSERLDRAEDSVGKCEEHLRRAEDILRNAIRRSREREAET